MSQDVKQSSASEQLAQPDSRRQACRLASRRVPVLDRQSIDKSLASAVDSTAKRPNQCAPHPHPHPHAIDVVVAVAVDFCCRSSPVSLNDSSSDPTPLHRVSLWTVPTPGRGGHDSSGGE